MADPYKRKEREVGGRGIRSTNKNTTRVVEKTSKVSENIYAKVELIDGTDRREGEREIRIDDGV
jgi:hypothetical protein